MNMETCHMAEHYKERVCVREREKEIVTMPVYVAVCKTLSVKEWCDLENRVRVRSRLFEMAPFDRSHTSSYSPSVVTMAIFCIVTDIQGVSKKKPPKTFWNIFTSIKSFCVKFCKLVVNSCQFLYIYLNISSNGINFFHKYSSFSPC